MQKLLSIVCLVLIASIIADAKQSRAVQNFHCNELVNDQLQLEFDASHTYLSIYNYFARDLVALDGFAKMFKHSWKEELEHAEKLIDYIHLRGGNISLPSIQRPVNDTLWTSMTTCQILEIVLGLEMKVHEALLKVHKCATGVDVLAEDPHLQDFIESEYLNEQIIANKELADLMTRLERSTMQRNADGTKTCFCDGLGLFIIDKELSAKYTKQ